jgi:glutamate formiminotransferase
VPYDASVQDANALAQRIASAAPVPVYNYTDDLPELRRRLRSPHEAHPTAGVLCIGVRGPLIAFNVNLRSTIADARAIVTELRRLPGVRALAFELPARALVQVSMNLTEPSITGPRAAFDRVAELATDIADAEIVGLIPAANKTELEGLPLRAPARSVEEALRG